jgi:hypothetical protein
MRAPVVAFALASLLAACQPQPPQQEAPAVAANPAPEGNPAANVTAVSPAEPAVAGVGGYDASVFNFGGYGSARFNDDAAAVRSAFGAPLDAAPPPESPEACHYLLSRPRGPEGFGLAFMVEGGKFVRYDIDTPTLVAPGGLRVGMRAQDVHAAFGSAVQVQPHKYVEGGQVLVVRPADGGEARLVFETDSAGLITSWRIGLEPQVHYVEGCS